MLPSAQIDEMNSFAMIKYLHDYIVYIQRWQVRIMINIRSKTAIGPVTHTLQQHRIPALSSSWNLSHIYYRDLFLLKSIFHV